MLRSLTSTSSFVPKSEVYAASTPDQIPPASSRSQTVPSTPSSASSFACASSASRYVSENVRIADDQPSESFASFELVDVIGMQPHAAV